MIQSAVSPKSLSRSRRLLFRIGLVVAGLMGVFNVINGVGSLIDPMFGQTDPTVAPQPTWMSVLLVIFGAATLGALVPAWNWIRWGIVVVVASRLAEAWSAVVLPFLPDAPEGIATFVIALIVVGTGVSLMVAQAFWVKDD